MIASCIACGIVMLVLAFLLFVSIFALTKIKSRDEFKHFYTWIPIIAIVVIIGLAIPVLNYFIPSAKQEIGRVYFENHGSETVTGELTIKDVSVYETRGASYYVCLKIGETELYPATAFSEESYKRLEKCQGLNVSATIITEDSEIGDSVASMNGKTWNYDCVVLKILLTDD